VNELPLLPRPVNVASIGATPQARRVEATEQERREISAALDLVDLRTLEADLELWRGSRGRIHVKGRVVADIVQSCVVSLEPVAQHIDEPIAMVFVETGEADAEPRPGAEIRVDPANEDPPEVLPGLTLDLGPIVIEHLVLAIDPYPRAPGAELPGSGEGTSDSPDSPFAVLAKLREKSPRK
jgi:uncharacterized metal-binding protein YceD (DUF177 family)